MKIQQKLNHDVTTHYYGATIIKETCGTKNGTQDDPHIAKS